MTDLTQTNILVITTHYPYGTIQENWIEPELIELSRRFSKVHVLPMKQLSGLRALPEHVELWTPLAGMDRKVFFARQALRSATWRYFISAMRECADGPGLTVGRTIVNFKFSCYRSALEVDKRLNSFLTAPGAKIVYAYWGHLAALAIPKAHAYRAATCVRYHRTDLVADGPEDGFLPWRMELRSATELNAFVSEDGHNFFAASAGNTYKGSCGVYRLGTQDFGPARPRQDPTHDQPIVIVSASWITPIKRVEKIAELVGALARYRRVIWHHFGGGQMDVVDRAVMAARKAGAEITMHGIVPVTDLQRFYRENDVTLFVNLSQHEGIPVSIMEALNAGIPVVATAAGGSAEVVFDGRSGIVVTPELEADSDGLARYVLNALKPEGDLATARPREIWKNLCDAETLAAAFVDKLYRLVVQRPGQQD